MKHNDINLILATGRPGMVKAAYSSGKPAIGVGAGNVPIVIDETADVKRAVASILMSKTFDNGVVCASEQAVIVVDSIYNQVKERFSNHDGYILSKDEADKVRKVLLINGALNADIVGQPATKIAAMAGVTVPATTKILIGEGLELCAEGSSSLMRSFPRPWVCSAPRILKTLSRWPAPWSTSVVSVTPQVCTPTRIAISSYQILRRQDEDCPYPDQHPLHPGWYRWPDFALAPSLTLGCGSWSGNSISENVRSQAPDRQEDSRKTGRKYAVAQTSEIHLLPSWFPADRLGRPGRQEARHGGN
ncbi:aldehyde dehydrogenase family protein [Escherichia coli]